MTTEWTVSAATDRVDLGAARQAEITFTVTNPGPVADQAVLEIVTSDNADRSWFPVELPQRAITAGATVPYVVKAQVPATAPTGDYWLQARVYSSDTPPEESSRLSGRITFVLSSGPPPTFRWWPAVAALMVLVVLGVTGWLVFARAGEPATMPDLVGQTEAEATNRLDALGLSAMPAYHHQPADAGTVLSQSVSPGTEVRAGGGVFLEVAVALDPVALGAPGNGASFNTGAFPTMTWQPVQYASGYRITVQTEICNFKTSPAKCGFYTESTVPSGASKLHSRSVLTAPGTTVTPAIKLVGPSPILIISQDHYAHSGRVRWQVVALDDYDTTGPPSGTFAFKLTLLSKLPLKDLKTDFDKKP